MARSTFARLAFAVAATAAIAVVTATAPAGAQAPAATGFVRVGHFAPSQTAVDVVVDGEVVLSALDYRDVSPYLELPAGAHDFALRTAGTDEQLLAVSAGVPSDGAVTVGAVSTRTGLAAQVYDDDLQTPAMGQALVRFIHTAPAAGPVDITVVDGPTLATGLGYPEATDYAPVAAGTYDLAVAAVDTGNVVLAIDGWTATAGTQASVVVIEGLDGQLDVVPLSDAVGAAQAPTGGMATGLGGLALAGDTARVAAPATDGPSRLPLAAATFAGLAALVLMATSRRSPALVRARR